MDIIFKKKLGAGVMGTVYLINYGNKKIPAIYKIEKYLDLESYNRQIDFNDTVVKNYSKDFLNLIQYGIINNCKHKQTIPKFVDNKHKKWLLEKNESKTCYYLIYTPVLDGTYYDVMYDLTKKQKLDMIYQIVYKINILNKHGYSHRDTHNKNIMYKKRNNKYKWYLIDYGLIYHNKYKNKTIEDIDMKSFINDIINFIFTIMNNKVLDYAMSKDKDFIPYSLFIKKIKSSSEYKNILKYIPLNVRKNKFLFNDSITLITIIYHYELYMDILGYNRKKYEHLYTEQDYPDLLIYMLKNSYKPDKILNYIKKYKTS